jgi:peptide/nickel transport system substrate-binding protein
LKTTQKTAAAAIIVAIMVGTAAAIYFSHMSVAPSISLAPTTSVAVQGTQIAFTVYGLESNGIATVYFGDDHEANTTSTVTYTYHTPGRYLVAAQEFVNDQPVASTFSALQTIQVTPQVSASLAPLISVPAVSFDVTRNPSAPVVRVGDNVILYGGFLEPPSGTNITITEYLWDFGNGVTKTVTANSTSFKPAGNPSTATYRQPGLYPVTLTLETENSTSRATYKTSVEQTLAVGSASQTYAVFLYGGIVPNPSVINVAENYPGGPYTFDPNVEYDLIGLEVVGNIFSPLLFYNGSSTTNFVPMAATQVPSVSNGEISPDYTTYTFQIRSGLKFSNGDPLTVYDVWYSVIRVMLFASVGPNWILAQYLSSTPVWPIIANASDTADFNAIMNAVRYSNSSGTVTFKLVRPIIPQLFFTAIAYLPGILDSSWLQSVGAGITFTPAGFYAYQNQGNLGSYNLEVQNSPVSSGPYMIQNYVSGQSITLIPNPGFRGVPGIPTPNNTVVIQWVKDAETGYDLFRSGQVDIVTALPTNYFPLIKQEVANGQAALYQSPTLFARFFSFTLGINETAMKATFGSQYHIPSDYFANLNVRKAFAYAFNYSKYINEILGNTKYGVDFGSSYAGLIIKGLPYYVPETELQNIPAYNLTYAKQLLEQSGEYGTSVNIPVVIRSGAALDFEAADMWAAAINSIDPNIVITPIYAPVSIWREGEIYGSIPIWAGDWGADYPYPSDFVDPFYQIPWAVDYLNSTGHPDQAAMQAQMNSLIEEADLTTNATLAAQDYKQAEQIAINLYMYVYTVVPNQFWVVKPYMNGYQGQISYQQNPMFGGSGVGLYFWWVKTCGSSQACSGRNVGP